MASIIAYETNWRRVLKAIEMGWDDSDPEQVAFSFPNEAKAGDRVLYYVGGKFQYYFGHGKVLSNWKFAKTGPWSGTQYAYSEPMKVLETPVPGDDVTVATGFTAPKRAMTVPVDLEAVVWKAARGRPLTQVERAMEGVATEARSRYRDPRLRQSALQLAGGLCAACGVNYWTRTSGLGRYCLVVHHKNQLKDTDQPRETKVSDLAVICANCHMMIHSNPAKALSVAQLRSRLRKSGG